MLLSELSLHIRLLESLELRTAYKKDLYWHLDFDSIDPIYISSIHLNNHSLYVNFRLVNGNRSLYYSVTDKGKVLESHYYESTEIDPVYDSIPIDMLNSIELLFTSTLANYVKS